MRLNSRAESAIDAAERGELERATTAVIDLIAEDYNNADSHRAWGRVLLAKGMTSDAVSAFRTAIAIDPRRADLYFGLAEAILVHAEHNPFLPLSTWNDARQAVLDGLERGPDELIGHALLRKVEQQRARALS